MYLVCTTVSTKRNLARHSTVSLDYVNRYSYKCLHFQVYQKRTWKYNSFILVGKTLNWITRSEYLGNSHTPLHTHLGKKVKSSSDKIRVREGKEGEQDFEVDRERGREREYKKYNSNMFNKRIPTWVSKNFQNGDLHFRGKIKKSSWTKS